MADTFEPVKPNRFLKVNISTAGIDQTYKFDDGTGDPFLGTIWRAIYNVAITPQSHSSHIHKDFSGSSSYNGLNVEVGDWIATTMGARAMRIVDILEQRPGSIRVVLEDTGRYNTFQEPNGLGQPFILSGPGYLFQVNDDLVPLVHNLPGSLLLPPSWQSEITARFTEWRETYGIWERTYNHGFVLGDLLTIATEDDVQPTVTTGTNPSPTTNAGEEGRINTTLITWPSLSGTSAIVNFLNSLNIDNGNVVASNFSGFVRLTAADGRDIIIQDIDTALNFSVIGLESSGNGTREGSFKKVTTNQQVPVAVVSKLGITPNEFYYKWLGVAESFDKVTPGDIGSTIYKTEDGYLTTNPHIENKAIMVKRDIPRSNIVLGKVGGSTIPSAAFAINNVIITLTTGLLTDTVNEINSAMASASVNHIIASDNGGALQLENTRGEKIVVWDDVMGDITSDFGIRNYNNNGSNLTKVVSFNYPSTQRQQVFMPTTVIGSGGVPLSSAGQDIFITVDGDTKTLTFPNAFNLQEAADFINENDEMIRCEVKAEFVEPGILAINYLKGGDLSVSDGPTGSSATELLGSSVNIGIENRTHGYHLKARNNVGSVIREHKVVTLDSFDPTYPNEVLIQTVTAITDRPYGVTVSYIPNQDRALVLANGLLKTTLDTTGAAIGDLVYFDFAGNLTLTAGSVAIGFVHEIGTNAQVYINIGGVSSGGDQIIYNHRQVSLAEETSQVLVLPVDAGEAVYMFVNGLGNENFTFNPLTKELTFTDTGYSLEENDTATVVYKKDI